MEFQIFVHKLSRFISILTLKIRFLDAKHEKIVAFGIKSFLAVFFMSKIQGIFCLRCFLRLWKNIKSVKIYFISSFLHFCNYTVCIQFVGAICPKVKKQTSKQSSKELCKNMISTWLVFDAWMYVFRKML